MSLLSILAQDDGGGGAAVVQLGILLMIPLAMYFLMIRPQRRRMREQQSMQRSIEVGDEVVTTSGMYGFVTGIEDNVFWLEIDDDVQIRIARAAVQSRVLPSVTSDVADDDVAKSDPQ
jgi:preprotein translocase subunit YajC